MNDTPTIEVQSVDSCPRAEKALALARDVAGALGPGVVVEQTIVDDASAKEGLLSGSPSIRVGGAEVRGQPVEGDPLSRRDDEAGAGLPPRWMIEAAVLRAFRPRGLLFLCVANSARSQMAEGIARDLAPADVKIFSAGSAPTHLQPEAVTVLEEIGVDASAQRSKNVTEIPKEDVDVVFTLCAEEECPVFLGEARRVHWELGDPATVEGPDDARLASFRAIRDELRRRIAALFAPPGRPAHVLTILAVGDLERSTHFYSQAFGWTASVVTAVYVEFSLPGGQRIGLYQREGFAKNTGLAPSPVAAGAISGTEIYLRCDDLDREIAALERLGARLLSSRACRPWGDDVAYFADPDGNVIALAVIT